MPKYNTLTHEETIPFLLPSPEDPILEEIKKLAQIKIPPNASEIVRACLLIGYAHSLFQHSGNNLPSANDPLTILKEAQSGQSFRCVEYSILASALLVAHNIPARLIGLKTSDVETREYGAGHMVIEFWSNEIQKWIMSDVQAGILLDTSGLLSAFELGVAIRDSKPVGYSHVTWSRFKDNEPYDDKPSYVEWIREYLHFYDTPLQYDFRHKDRSKERIVMLVPENATPPKMFEGKFAMNVQYTRSVLDFYAKPLTQN